MSRERFAALPAALIGTGFIGPVHLEGLRRAGVPVLGVLGSSPEKSAIAAKQMGLPRGYADLAELLADEAVKVVHITSPNRCHYEQVKAALAAGKHVLCEKPLAMDSRESAELCFLAKKSGLVCGVNYNIRYYPLCREMQTQIARGELGNLFHIGGSYLQDWLIKQTDFNWRVLSAESGPLRAVADIGTHWLDLAQYVAGDQIVSVCASLGTVFQQRLRSCGETKTFTAGIAPQPTEYDAVPIDTDDHASILLRFSRGALGVLQVSQVMAGKKNCLRLEIAGGKKSFVWESAKPNELWIGKRDEASSLLVRDPALLSDAARGITSYPGEHNEGFPDSFKQLFTEFYQYILSGDASVPLPFPTFADGHREMLLCDAILESSRSGAFVSVASS